MVRVALREGSSTKVYANKMRAELELLEEQGVLAVGNAFSPILFVKGKPTDEERAGAAPFCGVDGKALRASIQALGYAPEDWAAMATWREDGSRLDEALFRQAIAAFAPFTLVICDEEAAAVARDAFANDLVLVNDLESAMLMAGYVVRVGGMRVLNLGGFADALGSARDKQLMWARLKQIPPLGEPY